MTKAGNDASETLRVFAAVTIRMFPSLGEVLSRLAQMGKAVRAVHDEQLHVTLKFYGDVAKETVPPLSEELTRTAAQATPFDWSLRGVGAFPSPARPSVVWAGAADDDGRLSGLAESIERFSDRLGFSREARPFHPHVTLARVKFRPPPELGELLHESAEQEFGPQRAEEIILYRSELGPGGSIYTPLHVARLGP